MRRRRAKIGNSNGGTQENTKFFESRPRFTSLNYTPKAARNKELKGNEVKVRTRSSVSKCVTKKREKQNAVNLLEHQQILDKINSLNVKQVESYNSVPVNKSWSKYIPYSANIFGLDSIRVYVPWSRNYVPLDATKLFQQQHYNQKHNNITKELEKWQINGRTIPSNVISIIVNFELERKKRNNQNQIKQVKDKYLSNHIDQAFYLKQKYNNIGIKTKVEKNNVRQLMKDYINSRQYEVGEYTTRLNTATKNRNRAQIALNNRTTQNGKLTSIITTQNAKLALKQKNFPNKKVARLFPRTLFGKRATLKNNVLEYVANTPFTKI